MAQLSLYDFSTVSINGKKADFAAQRGKVFLIVNTASACGFTPQFKGLEQLWQDYARRGLVVVGFPSNQFGAQDPGSNDEIASFCEMNYGVTFPMMAKVDVNGSKAEPLWQWLKGEAPGLMGSQAIKWNFTKFLVGRDGQVIKRYAPNDEPQERRIEAHSAGASAHLAGRASARRRGARARLVDHHRRTMFQHLEPYAGDPILSLNEAFHADPRPHKVNLSIGIYFDDDGRIPVLGCVHEAEAQMLAAAGPKPYLPIEGAGDMRSAVQALLFGADHEAVTGGRIATLQTIGSSGGLKVGADFIKRWLPGSAVWVSDPSWDNHRAMFEGAGLAVHTYPYYDADTGGLQVRRHAGRAAHRAGRQRGAAARLLPQPDRRRPDARAVARTAATAARARVAALPRHRLPGLSATASRRTPSRSGCWPRPA